MEYLTDMVTKVPEGTSSAKVEALRAAEAVRAAELSKSGQLIRLWRPPLGPGEWRSIGLFRAADETELREILASLPLHIWMQVSITPLTPHPNDPEYRALKLWIIRSLSNVCYYFLYLGLRLVSVAHSTTAPTSGSHAALLVEPCITCFWGHELVA
jgi:muconolactone D-isomerase